MNSQTYGRELAELTARVADRHPDDEDAQRAAEYAAQVVRDGNVVTDAATPDRLARVRLHAKAHEESLELMRDVFDVIVARGEVTYRELERQLEFRDCGVHDLYVEFIAPGIDQIEADARQYRMVP